MAIAPFAGVIEPALVAAEIRRSIQRQTTDVTAYDLYLRARADSMSWERSRLLRALDLLSKALELDPYYGPALVLAAFCHQNLDMNGWSEDPERERQQSVAGRSGFKRSEFSKCSMPRSICPAQSLSHPLSQVRSWDRVQESDSAPTSCGECRFLCSLRRNRLRGAACAGGT